jgi:hypothetical protein
MIRYADQEEAEMELRGEEKGYDMQEAFTESCIDQSGRSTQQPT